MLDDKFKQFAANFLPIPSQSAPNLPSSESNWNHITYGSKLEKSKLLIQADEEKQITHTEAADLMRIESTFRYSMSLKN
jgi:hypothetical protein